MWRGGVLPRVLQQPTLPVASTAVGGAADGCGRRWLVLDGALAAGAIDGGWLRPLLAVPRRAAAGGGESDGPLPPAVELPTGEALRVDAGVRVLLEASSLAHAPPHAHALLGVVYPNPYPNPNPDPNPNPKLLAHLQGYHHSPVTSRGGSLVNSLNASPDSSRNASRDASPARQRDGKSKSGSAERHSTAGPGALLRVRVRLRLRLRVRVRLRLRFRVRVRVGVRVRCVALEDAGRRLAW